MSKSYNGHKNWNHWNVSLWLNNDEGLYSVMMNHIRAAKNKDIAAHALLCTLKEFANERTPDGAPYSFSSIRAAMQGIEA